MQSTSVQKTSKLKKDIDVYIGGKDMFKKLLKERLGNEKGLTLIELLAVIVILAIVAAIAIPAIGNIIDNSRFSAVKSDAINGINAANIYYAENSDKNPTITNQQVDVATLISKGYLENKGKLTNGMKFGKTAADKPLSIDGTTLAYKGTNGIDFDNATVDDINKATRENAEAAAPTGGATDSRKLKVAAAGTD
ncbi:prepilin-type N-terminal cleavage/methylation domain-containing protein [Ureibacillus sp. NPDC094379]